MRHVPDLYLLGYLTAYFAVNDVMYVGHTDLQNIVGLPKVWGIVQHPKRSQPKINIIQNVFCINIFKPYVILDYMNFRVSILKKYDSYTFQRPFVIIFCDIIRLHRTDKRNILVDLFLRSSPNYGTTYFGSRDFYLRSQVQLIAHC